MGYRAFEAEMHNSHGLHIGDHAYGPGNVRNLRNNKNPQNLAVLNADSYTWFALVRIYVPILTADVS